MQRGTFVYQVSKNWNDSFEGNEITKRCKGGPLYTSLVKIEANYVRGYNIDKFLFSFLKALLSL